MLIPSGRMRFFSPSGSTHETPKLQQWWIDVDSDDPFELLEALGIAPPDARHHGEWVDVPTVYG